MTSMRGDGREQLGDCSTRICSDPGRELPDGRLASADFAGKQSNRATNGLYFDSTSDLLTAS
jgi:hypothetical protein